MLVLRALSLQEAYTGSTREVNINGRKWEVKIPRGANTGTKVRMTGAGPAGPQGQKSDLYLVINVSPDPRFERKNDTLYKTVSTDLYTAILGGEVKVPTLSGDVLLTIPAGTQPGQVFRLRDRGMPNIKNNQKMGDLYAKIDVRLPKNLSKDEQTLFKELAKKRKK